MLERSKAMFWWFVVGYFLVGIICAAAWMATASVTYVYEKGDWMFMLILVLLWPIFGTMFLSVLILLTVETQVYERMYRRRRK